ncbi:MAG TPA: hypothetical protein VGW33_15010 [Terriglobia bacterium]|nr:hypothetical protein [Terriglobia bacterium]
MVPLLSRISMYCFSQLRTTSTHFHLTNRQKAKSSKANEFNIRPISNIEENRRKQSQLGYVIYYQIITAILAHILRKLVPNSGVPLLRDTFAVGAGGERPRRETYELSGNVIENKQFEIERKLPRFDAG